MKEVKTVVCLLYILILSGCGAMKVNMHDHYNTSACPVTVIDMRPDQRIITGFDGSIFDISPSVKDVLHAKLCNNKRISDISSSNEIIVRIRDLKYHAVVHWFSVESILIIDGSLQYNGKYYEIQTAGVINQTGGTERIPRMLNESFEKFVASVAEHVQ